MFNYGLNYELNLKPKLLSKNKFKYINSIFELKDKFKILLINL